MRVKEDDPVLRLVLHLVIRDATLRPSSSTRESALIRKLEFGPLSINSILYLETQHKVQTLLNCDA